MKTRWGAAASVVVIALVAGGCTEKPAVPEPPARTYSAGEFVIAAATSTDTVKGAMVSEAFAAAASARPELGRFLVAADYESAGVPVVVISHALWTRRFGAAPASLGNRILVNEREATIVGVMPGAFTFPKGADVWVPWIQR